MRCGDRFVGVPGCFSMGGGSFWPSWAVPQLRFGSPEPARLTCRSQGRSAKSFRPFSGFLPMHRGLRSATYCNQALLRHVISRSAQNSFGSGPPFGPMVPSSEAWQR